MFRVSHSLLKKGRPFSNYEWALDLQEITHKISLGETYRNDQAGRKFVSFIAEAERLNLASELSAAPFYSVMTTLVCLVIKCIVFVSKVLSS